MRCGHGCDDSDWNRNRSSQRGAPPRTMQQRSDDFWLQVISAAGVGRLLITQSRSQAAGTVLRLVDASVAAVLSLAGEMPWATRNGAASSLGRLSACILVSIESLNQHWATPSASPGSRCHRYQNPSEVNPSGFSAPYIICSSSLFHRPRPPTDLPPTQPSTVVLERLSSLIPLRCGVWISSASHVCRCP
jgi:hypothetical protein